MRQHILIIGMLLAVISGGLSAAAEETGIYSDTFQSPDSLSHWTIHEGNWTVENGELINKDGGLISLNIPPGGRFSMEAEIHLPYKWFSVMVFFLDPENYATIYLWQNDWWETFEMEGQNIYNYIQHKDPDITTDTYHKIRVVSDYGLVSFFFDGKDKGFTVFPYRPGARVGFRTLEKSGLLKIKNFSLKKITPTDAGSVCQLRAKDFLKGVIYRDYEYGVKPGAPERLAFSDAPRLKYGFEPGGVFESCFVRIPVNVAKSGRLLMDVEGDGSRNNFFVILHDASGEQHLVLKTFLAWQGWQDVGVNLQTFLESPASMERFAIHWGGDNNQRIDFPIKGMDIGVAKDAIKVKDSGQVRFRNVRFTE